MTNAPLTRSNGHPRSPSAWPARIFLFLFAVGPFLPTLSNSFVYNDDKFLAQSKLLSAIPASSALTRIWHDPDLSEQFHPLTQAFYWIEHKLWGNNPLGFHAASIVLHAIATFLLWQIARQLHLRWAWLIAAIWAVHPMQVESIAWASAQATALGAVFYFAAMIAYLEAAIPATPDHFGRLVHPRPLILCGLLFFLGLLADPTICTLPLALLIIAWWKRGRISYRELFPLIPLLLFVLAVGLVMLNTAYAAPDSFPADSRLTPLLRLAVASRAMWFYLTKTVWPATYAFAYARWSLHLNRFAIEFIVAVVLSITSLIVLHRRITRAPAAAALIFAVTLLPFLNLFDISTTHFTFVADRYAVIALAPAIALIFTALFRRIRNGMPAVFLAPLIVITLHRCDSFADSRTLWLSSLDSNPNSPFALAQLGNLDLAAHHSDAAADSFRRALALDDNCLEAHLGLANVYLIAAMPDAAERQLSDLLDIAPTYEPARLALGYIYLRSNRLPDARKEADIAIAQHPRSFDANLFQAQVLDRSGHPDKAIGYYQALHDRDPTNDFVTQQLSRHQSSAISTKPSH